MFPPDFYFPEVNFQMENENYLKTLKARRHLYIDRSMADELIV